MGLDDIIRPKSKEEVADLERRGFRKDSGKWKFRIDITQLVSDYDHDEDPEAFRNSIIELLEGKVEDIGILRNNDEQKKFREVINKFRNLDPNPNPEELDQVLGALYDWADENDVWIESF